MAKNKVYIDVVVDDKGTTKRVAVNAKKLGGALEETAKSARTVDRNFKGASQQSANSTKNFSKMAQGISGGLVPAYATLAANVFAVTAAFQFLEKAADFRVLQDSQVAFSSATGKGFITLSTSIQKATDNLVSYKEAASAAAIGSAAGLSGDQLQSLAKGARDVSLVLGRSVPDSFDRLIRGVTKAEPELLDELGIILRLKDATEKYASATGQAAGDLGAFERSQAVALDVLDQLDKKYSSVTAAVELNSNKITKLRVAFEKVFLPIQKAVSGVSEVLADFLTGNLNALTAALTLFSLPILRSIIPATESWVESSQEAGDKIKTSIDDTSKSISNLKDKQLALRDSSKSLISSVSAQLGDIETKSKGAATIRQGGLPSKGQLKALIREAEKGRGIVTNMDAKMKASYVSNLRAMLAETTKTTVGIKARFKTAGLEIQKAGLYAQKAWQGSMLAITKTTKIMARAVDTAVKAISIVGFVLLIKDALVALLQTIGLVGQNQATLDLSESLKSSEDALKNLNKEFSKFAEVQKKFREKNDGPTLESYQAEQAFIAASGEGLLKALDAQNAFNAARDRTTQTTDSLASAEAKLQELRSKELDGATETDRRKNKITLDEQNALIVSIQEQRAEVERLKEAKEKMATVDTNMFQQYLLGYENVEQASEALREKIQQTTESFIASLEKQGIASSTSGARYIELLNILKDTGTLGDFRQEFEKLNEVYGINAQRVASILQTQLDLDRSFLNTVNSLTDFETAYTRSMQQVERQAIDIQNQIENTTNLETIEQLKALLEALNDQKSLYTKLQDMEIKNALRAQGIQIGVLEQSVGATTLEKENVARARSLAEIASKRLSLEERISAARAADGTISDAKAQQFNNELKLLELQEDAIRRQTDYLLSTVDVMEQALETSFERGLGALIKGTKNFKEVLLDIGTSILNAAADNIAKIATRALFTDEQGTEDKIRAAMIEAADYHGAVIRTAVEGAPSPTSPTAGDSGKGSATQSVGLMEKLFGAPTQKVKTGAPTQTAISEVGVVGTRGGSVTRFLGDFAAIFDKNAKGGFVEKLGAAFKSGGNIFMDIFSSLPQLFSSILGGLGGGIMSIFGFANGGIAKGGFRTAAYATGGIAKSPTVGLVGEGRYNEAIVPLPDGKSIPVMMGKGSGQQQNNIVINVSVDSEGGTKEDASGDREGMNLGKAISNAVQQELLNQKRSGGILNPYGVA